MHLKTTASDLEKVVFEPIVRSGRIFSHWVDFETVQAKHMAKDARDPAVWNQYVQTKCTVALKT